MDRTSDQTRPLPFPVLEQLIDLAAALAKKSSLLLAQVTIDLKDEIKQSILSLQAATIRINHDIHVVGKIQKVVNIATDLVGIAENVLDGDVKSIPGTVQKLLAELT